MSKKDEALKLALEALELNCSSQTESPATKAMAAIREALAEQPPCKYPHCAYPCPDLPDCRDAEQPAQQEPVAWGVDWGKAGDIPCVSIIKRLPNGEIEVVAVEYAPYSYTSPPATKPWVGLTDDERGQVYSDWRWNGSNSSNLELCQAIEAKLREKNA